MRQQQRGEEAILSQTERSDFTSIVHSSSRRGPFDLKHNVRVAGDFPLTPITAGQRGVVISFRYSMPRKSNFFENTPQLQQLIT